MYAGNYNHQSGQYRNGYTASRRLHVAYIPYDKVIGLSKINRLVQYYAKRPQVQERLTMQISSAMKEALRHNDVGVVIEADHLCVASRGIKDTNSRTVTASYSGQFEDQAIKQEFLSHIHDTNIIYNGAH
ncbi:GTP cyclohydrolase I [Parapedobacter sp. 2B3]|uniref:GTP cyclohydrolase I n=1 Tax=Parapedobacter sp. 2B3 TaxID=3342381 RepID=UPI0035B57A92